MLSHTNSFSKMQIHQHSVFPNMPVMHQNMKMSGRKNNERQINIACYNLQVCVNCSEALFGAGLSCFKLASENDRYFLLSRFYISDSLDSHVTHFYSKQQWTTFCSTVYTSMSHTNSWYILHTYSAPTNNKSYR